MISILLRSIPFLFTVMALSAFSLLEAKSFVSLDISAEETFSSLFHSLMYAVAIFLILWGGMGLLLLIIFFFRKLKNSFQSAWRDKVILFLPKKFLQYGAVALPESQEQGHV